MRFGIAVALALALVVAGCLSGATGGGAGESTDTTAPPSETTTTRTDSRTTTPTDTPTAPPTNLTRKTLPDRPDELTHESAVEYVKRFEAAYTFNRKLTNRTVELTVNPVRSSVRNATADGYVVHVEAGLSWTILRDGSEMAGHGLYTVNYLVNDTALVRGEAGGQVRPGPDPRNGTVVRTAENESVVGGTGETGGS